MNRPIASRGGWFCCLAHSRRQIITVASACLGAALALVAPAGADPAVVGEWEDPPLKCPDYDGDWPDGAMHAVHVVVRGQNGLQGRVLIWYAPGCEYQGLYMNYCPLTTPTPVDLMDCASCGSGGYCNRPARLWNPLTEVDDDEYRACQGPGMVDQSGRRP